MMKTNHRCLTVEGEPTPWRVWYKGEVLSTYQVTHLLNELLDENEELKCRLKKTEKKRDEIADYAATLMEKRVG